MTLYYDSGCSTAKSSPTANTVFASPGIPLTANVNSNSSTSIYAKAVDALGNVSTCTSLTTYTHDGVGPTVTNVTAVHGDGSFKAGELIPIKVTFTENVTVTGTPKLTLETGAVDAVLNYTSGSGTTELTFNYTVFAGDTSSDLDYGSTSALALDGGTIVDQVGNNAGVTLPAVGDAASIAGQKAIVIDTTAPSITYTSITPSSPSNVITPSSSAVLFLSSVVVSSSNPKMSKGSKGSSTVFSCWGVDRAS